MGDTRYTALRVVAHYKPLALWRMTSGGRSAERVLMENKFTVEYKLMINGDKFKGKGAAEIGGEKREFDIEGKREKKKPIDPAQRAKEIEEHLNGVAKYDRDNAAKFDLSKEEIEKASSLKLVDHFVSSPMRVWFHLYDDRNLGITRAIRGSKTVEAFVHRPDVIQAIIDSNKGAITEMKG